MIYVACSGFPVPVSRYFAEFHAVEISDTELGIPGSGTVRRWMRESPEGFGFTLLAPKAIAESGFRKTNENKAHIEALGQLTEQLRAKAVVFVGTSDFKHTKANRSTLKAFARWLPSGMPFAVFDLPGWKPEQVVQACESPRAIAAHDPLNDALPASADLAYLRLPGPAGHRSRYDEAALERAVVQCRETSKHVKTVFCVFRNIDMYANAAFLRDRLR